MALKVVAAAQNSEQLDTFVRTLLLLNSRKGQAAIEGPKTTQLLLPDEKKERKITYLLPGNDKISIDKKDLPALTRAADVIESKFKVIHDLLEYQEEDGATKSVILQAEYYADFICSWTKNKKEFPEEEIAFSCVFIS